MATGVDRLDVMAALLFVGYGFVGLVIPSTSVLAMEEHGEIAGTASALMGTLQFAIGAVAMGVAGVFFDGTPLPMVVGIADLRGDLLRSDPGDARPGARSRRSAGRIGKRRHVREGRGLPSLFVSALQGSYHRTSPRSEGRVAAERLPAAMASATTISIAATAKVIRMPAATASGRRRRDVGRRRCEREHGAHDGCAGDEPEIARQAEHAGNDASLVGADIRHDGGVVGCLKQLVARGQDGDGGDVAGNAEHRRKHGQGNEPAAMPTSPTTTMTGAPRRSTMRPAGTPVSAEMTGPIAITIPTSAASSPSARER